MTKEQALQALNEIYQVSFQAAMPGQVHARCQVLNKQLAEWISSQKEKELKEKIAEERKAKEKIK